MKLVETELGQRGCAGGGGHDGHRLRRRRHPSDVCRHGAQSGGPSTRQAQPRVPPQGRLRHQPASGKPHLSGGKITRTIVPAGKRTHSTGTERRLQDFRFHGAVCQGCLLRSRCFAAKGMKGRQVLIHPPESLPQEPRALQQNAKYDDCRRRRVVAEHRLARSSTGGLGIRQARYFGPAKSKFQVYLGGHGGQANPADQANRCGR